MTIQIQFNFVSDFSEGVGKIGKGNTPHKFFEGKN